jgi:hypothetical protein
MKTESEILAHLQFQYQYLKHIEEESESLPTRGHWRMQKRYIEALEWVLGLE